MATPTGPSQGMLYGLGSASTVLNDIADGQAYRDTQFRQTEQLKNQIAFTRQILEKQKVARDQEIIRQQMMAQAAGDAFAKSKAQFNDVEGDIGAKTNSIADTFRAVLNQGGPASVAPEARGPAGELEAALRAQESAGIANEATNLAGAQAFGKSMTDKGYALNEQGTLAGLLRNFAGGSQGASNSEVASLEGRLFQSPIQKPEPSMIGDLLFGGGLLGLKQMYPTQENATTPLNQFSLGYPGTRSGLNPNARSGLDPINSGVGLKINGANGVRYVGGD